VHPRSGAIISSVFVAFPESFVYWECLVCWDCPVHCEFIVHWEFMVHLEFPVYWAILLPVHSSIFRFELWL
jgi:hypothetical protein